ncbi:MAG: hypothetical protein K940chlam8_00429 [Chlamydiae bacterium]|nr:hypothetical protein [Chlamydiota bacterium]
MKKILLTFLPLFFLFAPMKLLANENLPVIVVDFAKCFEKSKVGMAKQKEMKELNEKLSSQFEEAHKKLKDLEAKLSDPDHLDAISPEEEGNLKREKETLQQQLGAFQMQFQEMMQQAQGKLVQELLSYVNSASGVVAGEKKCSLVVNKETIFYHDPAMDFTDLVINQMDVEFDKTKEKSETEKVENE